MSLIPAPTKYAKMRGNADLVYGSICMVLSDRQEQACTEQQSQSACRSVSWEQFGPDEWQLLPRMAQAEGVGPLLYWHFKNQDWPPGIPKNVAAALMGQYHTTLGQNTLLFQELDIILGPFEEAEIPVIPLKGAALAQTVYENLGLRPMGDLDLLAHLRTVVEW